MPTYKALILLSTVGLMTVSTAAETVKSTQKYDAIKIATIINMYKQDIKNEGMDHPTVLQQTANIDLQTAMQTEQAYFDENQSSCHIDYDVLWDSQDPDYTQDKTFAISEQGWVQVSLAQGRDVHYELSCENETCQVADVILDQDGTSLRKHLLEHCR